MPTPGSSSLAQLVALAEQLVAAADREHDRAAVAPPRAARRAWSRHVLGHRDLVAVLAAAHVEEVVGRGVQRLADWPEAASSKPRPRHSQRARRTAMLPRSA